MTVEDLKSLPRDTKVLYHGEVWKFKHLGKTGNFPRAKITRGDEIFHCARPEDLTLADKT